MTLVNNFLNKAKRFYRDTSASITIVMGAAIPIVIVTGGVSLDMLRVQTQENAATSTMNSIGAFASAINTCTGKSGTDLSTCTSDLQTKVDSYLASLVAPGNLKATVTPGLWCSNGFTSGTCSSSTGLSAVQIAGTLSTNTNFLRLFGAATIKRGILMTMVNDKITSIASAAICPALALDERVLKHPTAGRVAWDDRANAPRITTRIDLSEGDGSSNSLNSETGSISLSNPYYFIDTGEKGRISWPNIETKSTSSTAPIDPIYPPTSDVYDLTSSKTYTAIKYNSDFPAYSSGFGRKVADPRFKDTVYTSDSGAPQMLRLLKDYEGKNCIALVVRDTGSNNKVQVVGSTEIYLEKLCDGKRSYNSSTKKFNPLKDDGITADPDCSYSSDTGKVRITAKFRLGSDRKTDTDAYTPSDKNKYRGESKGDSSKGMVYGMNGSVNKVEDKREYK